MHLTEPFRRVTTVATMSRVVQDTDSLSHGRPALFEQRGVCFWQRCPAALNAVSQVSAIETRGV